MIGTEPGRDTLAARAADRFRAFRAGQEAAMDELVGLLTPILWHTARGQRLDCQTAEDVVQAVWLAFVRATDSIGDPQAVLQWLIVTTRRESWRAAKRQERTSPTDFHDDAVVAPVHDRPEEQALRGEADGRLWRHVHRLPQRCQALLRVIAFADRPAYAAVAQALGMPIGSIGPTRGRCLAKLRQLIVEDPSWEA